MSMRAWFLDVPAEGARKEEYDLMFSHKVSMTFNWGVLLTAEEKVFRGGLMDILVRDRFGDVKKEEELICGEGNCILAYIM